METPGTDSGKPASAQARSAPAAVAPKSNDLLSRANYGCHVTGRIDAVSAVEHKSGKSAKGNDYSFYQQSASISMGGEMIDITFSADKEPEGNLCPFELDEVVRVKVAKPRIYAGKVSYDFAG